MAAESAQWSIWALVRAQHGVISLWQLLDRGFTYAAIKHRLRTGRLHALPFHGVYAVGRREVSQYGTWMAAVLSCGPGAALSHDSAAALLGIARPSGDIHVSTPRHCRVQHVWTHRRNPMLPTTTVRSIPVVQPLFTLLDLAATWAPDRLEAAINEADKLGLINAGTLRQELDGISRRPGLGRLKQLLDSYQPTDTDLERRFLAIVRKARLPLPETQQWINGHRVDFHWPDLGLVVETDGLTYHRTASSQLADRKRDQAHTAAGLTQLRFANAQVRYAPESVTETLCAVIARLRG